MAKERDYEAEMRLPAGQTCASCLWLKRCGFYPSKFTPAITTEKRNP